MPDRIGSVDHSFGWARFCLEGNGTIGSVMGFRLTCWRDRRPLQEATMRRGCLLLDAWCLVSCGQRMADYVQRPTGECQPAYIIPPSRFGDAGGTR